MACSAIEMLEGRMLMATFTVNALADAAAVNPASGDGTSTLGAGKITLRSAIQAADATAGPSTINLPAGTYTLSIAPTVANDAASGDLNITGSLTLTGAGAATTTINANKIDRVLNVSGTGTVAISGVTITGGDDFAATPLSQGGSGGGGILLKTASLTLTGCVVTGNTANDYGGGGGGIFNDAAQLTLNSTTVDSNLARDQSTRGGAISGGGIYALSQSKTTLINSTVSRNQIGLPTDFVLFVPYNGGGIYNGFGGQLILTNSTVRDNSANGSYGGSGSGGGVYNSGQATLTNCTVSGNITTVGESSGDPGVDPGGGGGIASVGGTLVVSESTISGNNTGGNGGGVLILDPSAGEISPGPAGSITNSTIAQNAGGGLYLDTPRSFTIKNTILAGNLVDALGKANYVQGTHGPITSLGHNLSSDASAATVFAAAGDLNNVDAKLGPLADNGGPTFTRALLAGSPAINAGDPAGAPATDQRGFPRVQGATIDIGAYEFGTAVSSTLTLAGPTGPTFVGQSATFTATVTASAGTPTGSVTFKDGSTPLKTVALDASGHATFATAALGVGAHTITAVYSGDLTFATSSATATAAVQAAPTTTTVLTSSPNPSTMGQSVTLTATVTETGSTGTPTGTVTFKDGANSLKTVALDASGHASLVTSALSVGAHAITAVYSGDAKFPASTGSATQTVTGDGPRVTSIRRFGYHNRPTVLVLGFSTPLNPATAQNLANYALSGPIGRNGGHAIAIASAVYDPTAHTVTLHPRHTLNLHRHYRLQISGTHAGGVTNTSGLLLDGAGTGHPGSDYIRTFGMDIFVGVHPGLSPLAARRHPAEQS